VQNIGDDENMKELEEKRKRATHTIDKINATLHSKKRIITAVQRYRLLCDKDLLQELIKKIDIKVQKEQVSTLKSEIECKGGEYERFDIKIN
jgi:hypothetical protein